MCNTISLKCLFFAAFQSIQFSNYSSLQSHRLVRFLYLIQFVQCVMSEITSNVNLFRTVLITYGVSSFIFLFLCFRMIRKVSHLTNLFGFTLVSGPFHRVETGVTLLATHHSLLEGMYSKLQLTVVVQ